MLLMANTARLFEIVASVWAGSFCRTTRVSDRHLTEEVGKYRCDHEIKTVWQTRWLVAVHLDPLDRCSGSSWSELDVNQCAVLQKVLGLASVVR